MTSRGFRLDQDNRLNNFAIEPPVYVDTTVQAGWTEYAEKMNGRFAMIAVMGILGAELATGKDAIQQFGL